MVERHGFEHHVSDLLRSPPWRQNGRVGLAVEMAPWMDQLTKSGDGKLPPVVFF